MSRYSYLDWLLNEKSDDEPTQMSDDLKELFSYNLTSFRNKNVILSGLLRKKVPSHHQLVLRQPIVYLI